VTEISEYLTKALQALAITKERLVGNGADKVLKSVFDNLDKIPKQAIDQAFLERLFRLGVVKKHNGKTYKFQLASTGDQAIV